MNDPTFEGFELTVTAIATIALGPGRVLKGGAWRSHPGTAFDLMPHFPVATKDLKTLVVGLIGTPSDGLSAALASADYWPPIVTHQFSIEVGRVNVSCAGIVSIEHRQRPPIAAPEPPPVLHEEITLDGWRKRIAAMRGGPVPSRA